MKKLKVLFCVLIAFVACAFVLPKTEALAATVDSGKCGKNLTWTLTDDGTLTINGTGEMYDYYEVYIGYYVTSAPWGEYKNSLKTLKLCDDITSIGDHAFEGCSGFTGSLTIPNSVESIGESAFADTSFENIYFKGNAPEVTEATDEYSSFDSDETLYYIEGKTGWSSPTWNGYKTVAMESKDTFVIKYDANGGNGTPVEQLKKKNETLVLSTLIPEREGYTFLGWSTDKDAEHAQYQAGGEYIANMSATLYAVWEKIIYPDVTITVSDAETFGTGFFDVYLSIDKNPNIAEINFGLDYDRTKFSLAGYYDLGLTGWLVGVSEGEKAVWVNEKGSTATGGIIRLRFEIADGAEIEEEEINLVNVVVANADENKLNVCVVPGKVAVKDHIKGDVNEDGLVDVLDLLRLAKYVANMNVKINEYCADVNNDKQISVLDTLRLSKYLAGMNVKLV